MITVAVGTFMLGFDELLEAGDKSIAALGLTGFAQSGHSQYRPRHLDHMPFLDHAALMAKLGQSDVLVCHAGMGLIGDGLRAGCRIVIYPRRGATTRNHPANDQTAFAKALSARLDLGLCLKPEGLGLEIDRQLMAAGKPLVPPSSNIPHLIVRHLMATQRP